MTNEPKTQAGRALLDLLYRHHVTDDLDLSALDILAIEAEAAAAPAARHTKECFERQYVIELPENPYRSCICASEPAAAEPPLYCGRCGHPMHWKQCDRDYLDGRCECRNDGERAAQPPPCPECGAYLWSLNPCSANCSQSLSSRLLSSSTPP